MLREIKKKMVILNNRMPFSQDIKGYFADIERQEWIYRNMSIDGSGLSKGQIEAISKGEVYLNIPIGEHLRANLLDTILKKMLYFCDMRRSLDINLIKEFGKIITAEAGNIEYRKKSVTVAELGHVPPHPAEIEGEMNRLGKVLIDAQDADKLSEDLFLFAAKIHNEIVRIMPFGEEDKLLARVAAAYYIVSKGLPLVTLDIKEQDYNEMLADYMRTEELKDCKEWWQKALLDRLNLMIQLTRY